MGLGQELQDVNLSVLLQGLAITDFELSGYEDLVWRRHGIRLRLEGTVLSGLGFREPELPGDRATRTTVVRRSGANRIEENREISVHRRLGRDPVDRKHECGHNGLTFRTLLRGVQHSTRTCALSLCKPDLVYINIYNTNTKYI